MLAKVLILAKVFISAVPFIFDRISHLIHARIHFHTYKVVENPRNIVVIGGSYGGLYLATQLANSLPTGYRVVLIEKRSHFNFTWIFPRVSVVSGHEHKAFIPYGPGITALPTGSLQFHRSTATAIDERYVTLEDGTVFEFEYLALATGSTGFAPWHQATEEKEGGMNAFRDMQRGIQDAQNLVIVGGGAVGVELAADAKALYPQKNVSLIHSRDTLLNTFGPKLGAYAKEQLQELGIEVCLGERVSTATDGTTPGTVVLKSGQVIDYDLLIKCTGQKPASKILSALSPSSISSSGTILVKKTLQIEDFEFPNIYALGDVAETGGVRMGRAAGIQAMLVADNIVRAIKGKSLKEYKSIVLLEGGIDLTLGLTKGAVYFRDDKEEFLFPANKKIALDSEQAWKLNGARPFEDREYVVKVVQW